MLKGETIIELTDVRTGEVEVHKDSNMVTNALDIVLNTLSAVWLVDRFVACTKDKNYPLYDHLLGGVVLFPEALEENANNIWCPYTVDATGFASNKANSGDDRRRGSLNPNESMPVLDSFGKAVGYKYVWDFATSQANGVIASVCLTHPTAGYNWYGCKDSPTNQRFVPYTAIEGIQSSAQNPHWYYPVRCFMADLEMGYIYSWTDDGKIIKMRSYPSPKMGLVETPIFVEGNPDNLFTDAFDISTTEFWTFNQRRQFLRLSDTEIIGISTNGSASSPTTVKWINISVRTGAITEGSWSIQAPLCRSYGCVAISNGHMMWVSNDRKSVYKINLDNIASVAQILYTGDGVIDVADNYTSVTALPNGVVLGSNFYILNDILVPTVKFGDSQGNSLNFFTGFWADCYYYSWYYYNGGSYGGIARLNVGLIPQYLATINNLSSPVTKTADKTMKITYTITETE